MESKERSILRGIYQRSPYLLGKQVLGYTRFCETQLEWDKLVTGWYTPAKPNRCFSMALTPRETFKSCFFTITLAIWILICNPNLTILISGETISNAEGFLKEIKSKIALPRFIGIFGDWFNYNEWRDDAISIRPRTVWTKEASIETAGIGKALTGKHFDVVLNDDIVGQGDRDSEAKRTTTFSYSNGMFDILKKESGWMHWTGTRWHQQDYYGHVIKRLAPDFERKGIGKFNLHVKPAHNQAGGLNYPRLLPESRLLEMRTVKQGKDGIDISTFMAQYELNPLSSNEQIFKTFHKFNIATEEFSQFVQWTDPALSDKGTACYSAIVVIGKFKARQGWGVVLASVDRRSPQRLLDDHNRIYRIIRDQYQVPVSAYMEDNGFQLLLKNNAVAASNKEGDEVPTIGRMNTENKLARIRAMEPYVSQGFILFREDHETAPEGYQILMEELSSFPQSHMDAVDALQGAHKQTQSRYLSDGDVV